MDCFSEKKEKKLVKSRAFPRDIELSHGKILIIFVESSFGHNDESLTDETNHSNSTSNSSI